VLLRALSERDEDLGVHLADVAELARATGSRLGLSDEELEHVRLTALLHDVGKVAIPDSILHRQGPLRDEEWEYMRRHTLIGERIISAAPALVSVAKFVRSTHERWDGTGYPDALVGEQTPLVSRVVAVCDAYHAMTSQRPYRSQFDSERALAEILDCSGRQFDPAVVEAFAVVLEAERAKSPQHA
jgi:HD-GYP domain-containing protein (c-di-GMP phosphodiesterase class II)